MSTSNKLQNRGYSIDFTSLTKFKQEISSIFLQLVLYKKTRKKSYGKVGQLGRNRKRIRQ